MMSLRSVFVALVCWALVAPACGGAALNLVQGWNLVGNGSSGPVDVPATFGDAAKVASVWKWVAAKGAWAFYTPTLSAAELTGYASGKGYDVLAAINGGEGFWVNASQAHTVSGADGNALTAAGLAGSLTQGWNLAAIGESKTPRQFNDALGTTPPSPGAIVDNLTSLWAWDAAHAAWYFYAPNLERSGELAGYIASKAYRDFASDGRTLGEGVGFWVNMPSGTGSGGSTTSSSSTTSTTTTSTTATTTTTTTTLPASGAVNYELANKITFSACETSSSIPADLRLVLSAVPNWSAGTVTGTAYLGYADQSSETVVLSGVAGSFMHAGATVSYTLQQSTEATRVAVLKLSRPSASDGCVAASYYLRDGAQANLPPRVGQPSGEVALSQSKIINTTTGTVTATGCDTYTYTSGMTGAGNLWLGAKDTDGRVVALKWTSSSGKSGTGRTFGECVPVDGGATFTLEATDDQGAVSSFSWTVGKPVSVDARLAAMAGKWYVYRVTSSDSQGVVWRQSQYYHYDAASQTVSQTLCLDEVRSDAASAAAQMWPGVTGAKQCWESATSASDPLVKEALDNLVADGANGFVFRNPAVPAESMHFVAVDGLPAGYQVFDDDGRLMRTTQAPDSGGGTPSSDGAATASGQACLAEPYRNAATDAYDPQFDTFCQQAQFDACLHRATGQSVYDGEGRAACTILSGMLSALRSTWSCSYCPFPY